LWWSKLRNTFQKLTCGGVCIYLYSLNDSFSLLSIQGHFLCVVYKFMKLLIKICLRFCVWTGHIVFLFIKNKMGMTFPHVSCISCYDSSVVIVKTEYPSRYVNESSICISGWQMVIKIFCGVRFNVGYDSLVSREVLF
jgi:hypothetical protein